MCQKIITRCVAPQLQEGILTGIGPAQKCLFWSFINFTTMIINLSETDNFAIHVKEICYGNEAIELVVGEQTLEFMPTYMGHEPLTTLIRSILGFEYEEEDGLTCRCHSCRRLRVRRSAPGYR